MGKQWCYFLFMLWFTYLIVSSVLLFTKGFLLTRLVQTNNATCLSFAEIPCLHKDLTPVNVTNGHEEQCSKSDKLSYVLKNINSASSICLPQKSRIVLIVIDALRFDFTLFDAKLELPRPYQNKLPVIDRLLKQHPRLNRLYKFIADPPTTTMQRIKGLTTGSLPTFIDASSNFATAEIHEDNIIDQLLRNNLSAVFMGDDTWSGLYPDRFVRKYPYPSFNVWDLDTVDDGVRSHLYAELNNSDWSLLVAHFLGVDHCGHRYGPNHPEMTRKLTEMNTVIENIVDNLDADTMLFVIGDHGMTVSGDHGGASTDETTSALFVHSKSPLSSFLSQQTEHATVKQVSLVPTMSAILGVSIPFQNLGSLILDALPLPSTTETEESWQSSLFSLWANAQQMMTYIEEYSKQSPDTFDTDTLKSLSEQFSILNSKVLGVENETDFIDFAKECTVFMTSLRNVCETVWVQFDSFSMTRGLLFLFLSMFFVYTITDGIPNSRMPEIFMSSFLACSYVAMFVAAGVAVILHHFGFVANLLSTVFFFTSMVSQVMLVMLVIQNWELISVSWHDRSQKERLPNLVCRFVLIFFLCGLFSNSFIVEESYVLLFSLNTVIVVGTLSVIETRKKNAKPNQQQHSSKFKLILTSLGVLIMVRISVYFWKCREEQQWCFETLHGMTSKFETSKLQWTITVISMALFVTLTKVWLRNCGNMNGYSLTVTLAKFAPTVLVVCSSGFWVLNRLPSDTKNKLIGPWQANILAWIVYGLAGLGIAVTTVKPLCVYILPSKRDSSTVEVDDGSIIPQLFRKVKNLFNETGTEDVPVICGLGTVYSATFIIIGVYAVLFMALIHGDAVAPSTIIMFLAASFVLIITSIIRVEKATSIEQLLEIPNMSIFVWAILAQYFFYGTGHQPTFPNIPWEAAFVGTSGVFSSNFVPATLVVINTFSSYILMGFLLPLMLIMPFAVSIMLPTAIRKNNVLHKESLRGEVLLFERDGLMMTSAFTTSCKYIMVHGIRVFASMLAATIHCRHLMVWKIFAPKMIFETLALCATLVAVNLGFLLLIRVNHQVDRLVASLNKKYS